MKSNHCLANDTPAGYAYISDSMDEFEKRMDRVSQMGAGGGAGAKPGDGPEIVPPEVLQCVDGRGDKAIVSFFPSVDRKSCPRGTAVRS